MLTVIVILVIAYLMFHGHHSRKLYRRHAHKSFLSRCWISVPGPFHTRIGRRL